VVLLPWRRLASQPRTRVPVGSDVNACHGSAGVVLIVPALWAANGRPCWGGPLVYSSRPLLRHGGGFLDGLAVPRGAAICVVDWIRVGMRIRMAVVWPIGVFRRHPIALRCIRQWYAVAGKGCWQLVGRMTRNKRPKRLIVH